MRFDLGRWVFRHLAESPENLGHLGHLGQVEIAAGTHFEQFEQFEHRMDTMITDAHAEELVRQREDRARWEKQFGWKIKDRLGSMLPKGFTKRRCYADDWPNCFDHTFAIVATHEGVNDYGILTMPYGFNDDYAKELDEWCGEHGARWYINGWAWWNSATVAVVVVPERV